MRFPIAASRFCRQARAGGSGTMYSSGVVRALRRCLATDAGAKATDAAERVMITFSDFAGTQRTLPCKVGDRSAGVPARASLPLSEPRPAR